MENILEPLYINATILPNRIVFPAFQTNTGHPFVAPSTIPCPVMKEIPVDSEKKADFVAICRPQVADPSFVRKSIDNQIYTECNDCGNCLFFLRGEKYVHCPRNPELQDG